MEETKIYFYKMIVDNGGAPCVQDGLLSLAICKPQIRSTIDTNDFIIGFGSNVLDNKLIYIAKITDKLLDGEYYKQEKYYHNRIAYKRGEKHEACRSITGKSRFK